MKMKKKNDFSVPKIFKIFFLLKMKIKNEKQNDELQNVSIKMGFPFSSFQYEISVDVCMT